MRTFLRILLQSSSLQSAISIFNFNDKNNFEKTTNRESRTTRLMRGNFCGKMTDEKMNVWIISGTCFLLYKQILQSSFALKKYPPTTIVSEATTRSRVPHIGQHHSFGTLTSHYYLHFHSCLAFSVTNNRSSYLNFVKIKQQRKIGWYKIRWGKQTIKFEILINSSFELQM